MAHASKARELAVFAQMFLLNCTIREKPPNVKPLALCLAQGLSLDVEVEAQSERLKRQGFIEVKNGSTLDDDSITSITLFQDRSSGRRGDENAQRI